METVATCGGTYLAHKVLGPPALLGILGCAAKAVELVECLSEPETKAQGR